MAIQYIKDTFCTNLSKLWTKNNQDDQLSVEDRGINNIFQEVNQHQRVKPDQRSITSAVSQRTLAFRPKSLLEERLTTQFSEDFESGLAFFRNLGEDEKNAIQVVDLSQGKGAKVTSDELIEIINECPNIEVLNVSNNTIIDETFLKHLPSNLKGLQLDYTDYQKINSTSLATSFERFTKLEFLSLVGVNHQKELLLKLPTSLNKLRLSMWESLRREVLIYMFLYSVFHRLNNLKEVESFNIVKNLFEEERGSLPKARVCLLPESARMRQNCIIYSII